MKKDKEWLIKELLDDEVDDYDNHYNGGYEDGLAYALKLAHQLDEQEKVVIPQFVADWVEEMKQDERPLYSVMSTLMNKTNHEWAIWKSANMNFSEIVAQTWLYGYQLEKEKLYVVVLSNSNEKLGTYENVFLNKKDGVAFIDSCRLSTNDIKKHSQFALTEKQIKDYDPRFMAFAEEVAE